MNISFFLKLPPQHSLSFEECQILHKEISSFDTSSLNKEEATLLYNFVNLSLLHENVDLTLINKLKLKSDELEKLIILPIPNL